MSVTAAFMDWRNRKRQQEQTQMNPAVMPDSEEAGFDFAGAAVQAQLGNMAPRAKQQDQQPQSTKRPLTPHDTAWTPDGKKNTTIPTTTMQELEEGDRRSEKSMLASFQIPYYDKGIFEPPKFDTERGQGHQTAARAKLLGDAIREIVQAAYAAKGGSIPAYNPQPVQDSLGRYNQMLDDHGQKEYQQELQKINMSIKEMEAQGQARNARDRAAIEDRRLDDQQEREDMIRGENRADQAAKDAEAQRRWEAEHALNKQRVAQGWTRPGNTRPDQKHVLYSDESKNDIVIELDTSEAKALEDIVFKHLQDRMESLPKRDADMVKNRSSISDRDRWSLVNRYYNQIPEAVKWLEIGQEHLKQPDTRPFAPRWMTQRQYEGSAEAQQAYQPREDWRSRPSRSAPQQAAQTPQQGQQPEKMSRSEFASMIKQQYPDYQDVPDDELVNAILELYPEYREVISQ